MVTTDPHILERQPGKGIHLQLALDDAFADGDDQPLQFSAAEVRQHFAEQEHWAATETSTVNELDTLMSTLRLDGRTSTSDSASISSQSHAPADHESSHDPSVALSDQVDHHAEDYDKEISAHPIVYIDVSKPPSSRVSVVAQAEESAAASDETQYLEAPSPGPPALDLPTSASLPNTQTSVPPPQSHRSSRSTGPTMLQKVVSTTRPHFLPPKSRKEDLKHLADWETMMKQSQAKGSSDLTPTFASC